MKRRFEWIVYSILELTLPPTLRTLGARLAKLYSKTDHAYIGWSLIRVILRQFGWQHRNGNFPL